MSIDDLDESLHGFDPTELSPFFDPNAPVAITGANLPHWRQGGVIYFVTFRLCDSIPQVKLDQWRYDQKRWMEIHPPPLSDEDLAEYQRRFTARIHGWLDQGYGSCVLRIPECCEMVESALRHFEGTRYALHRFVVAANHVHALVRPLASETLEALLHSWKSYTAKAIVALPEAVERLKPFWDERNRRRASAKQSATRATRPLARNVWQKESFDHIVRSAASLEKFENYIAKHPTYSGGS